MLHLFLPAYKRHPKKTEPTSNSQAYLHGKPCDQRYFKVELQTTLGSSQVHLTLYQNIFWAFLAALIASQRQIRRCSHSFLKNVSSHDTRTQPLVETAEGKICILKKFGDFHGYRVTRWARKYQLYESE